LAPIANKYDAWAASLGYPHANHYIATKYADGTDNIGFHYDKPKSIKEKSLISVVKTGSHGRPFQLRDRIFFTKQQQATITREQKRKQDLNEKAKKWKAEQRTPCHFGKKLLLCAKIKLASTSLKKSKKSVDAVKTAHAKEQNKTKPSFNECVPPGTAIIMTLEDNLKTQHGVPVFDEAGPSGSLVFRTITERVPVMNEKRKSKASQKDAKRSRVR